jgi:hypothetical protein
MLKNTTSTPIVHRYVLMHLSKYTNILIIYETEGTQHPQPHCVTPDLNPSLSRSFYSNLRAFPANTTCQLNVFWHNSYTLCVNCAKVGVFKKANKISLCCLLESEYSSSLETEITLEVLGNLTHQTLEGDCDLQIIIMHKSQIKGCLIKYSTRSKCQYSRFLMRRSVDFW